MIEFLKQLPHLEHYGTPIYFIYLILAFLPIFVGLFFKKRFPIYEGLVSPTNFIVRKRTISGFSIFIPSCLSCP